MSKKRTGLLLLAGVLTFGAVGALASCGETTTDKVEATIAIANKDALKAEWRVEEADRDLTLTVTPEINIAEAIQNEDITFTTSDANVVAVMGTKLKAVGAGTATVTVYYGDASDSVELNVLPRDVVEATNIKDLVSKVFKDGKFAPADKTHVMKAAFVCVEPKGNTVITDGTDYFLAYGMQDGKDLKFGDNVTVEGKIAHYFGTMQFKDGKFIKSDSKDIKVPDPITFDYNKLKDMQKTAIKNNDGPVDPADFYQPIYGKVALKYTGDAHGNFLDRDGKPFVEVRFNKCGEDMDAIIKTLGYGDLIEVTGGMIGWNNGLKYYNMIPTAITVTKKAVQPTAAKLTIATAPKQFERLDLRPLVTLTPADADADLTFNIEDKDGILQAKGTEIIALKAGEVTITAVANGKIKSEPVKLTIGADKANNVFANPVEKTLTEMAALDGKVAHKDQLYIVTGEVTEASTDDQFGNMTIKDAEGKELKTYGVGTSILDFSLTEDGKIDKFSNPKEFNTKLINKAFKVGDTVRLLVFADTHKQAASYKTVFINKVVDEDAPLAITNSLFGSYPAGEATFKVGAINFKYKQFANFSPNTYFQTRIKDNVAAFVANETAFASEIDSIKITINSEKYNVKAKFAISFGTEFVAATAETAKEFAVTDKTVTEYTIKCDVAGAKFFRMEQTESGMGAFEKIEFILK